MCQNWTLNSKTIPSHLGALFLAIALVAQWNFFEVKGVVNVTLVDGENFQKTLIVI
jgi:hypothetical protein